MHEAGRVWQVRVDNFGLDRFATVQPTPGQSEAFWALNWPQDVFNLAVIERAGQITYSVATDDSPKVVTREESIELGVPVEVLLALETAAQGKTAAGSAEA